MPCANCRKELSSTTSTNVSYKIESDAFAFLLESGSTGSTSESMGLNNEQPNISISQAISTLFEASLKLHKKQVSTNSLLLMCSVCLASLTQLHSAYTKFMQLTLEGSYVQQLIESSVLWPNYKVPRNVDLYDDFSPLLEVKLEPVDEEEIKDDPDFVADRDPLQNDWQLEEEDLSFPRVRRSKRHLSRGNCSKVKRTVVVKKKGSGTSTRIERPPKEFPCSEDGCQKSFSEEKLRRRHVKFKHGKATPEELATRTCTECPTPKVFGLPSQLRLHQREVHSGETPFPCLKCDRQFPSTNRLRIHTLMKHPSSRGTAAADTEPLLCPHNCETEFRSKNSLKLHLKSVHGESISYTCTFCSKTFQRSTRYRRHLKYKHGQGLTPDDLEGRQCRECPKIFETRHQLRAHAASVHTKEKPFVCEVEGCGKKFPSKNYRNIHWHMKHKKDPQRFPCEHCGKSYCSKTVLQEHIETLHLGVRNIICEICGKACTRQSALNRHMETHDVTRQRQFECPICNQRFISERTLKCHAITHSGVRDQQCSHCGDTFLHAASLRRHLHAKHGVKPTKGEDSKEGHECKQCGKVFKLKEYLSQHLRSRTHGGRGHTAQRRREAVAGDDDEITSDGTRQKKLKGASDPKDVAAGMTKKIKGDSQGGTGVTAVQTFSLVAVPQQIFWTSEAFLQGTGGGTSQYFKQS